MIGLGSKIIGSSITSDNAPALSTLGDFTLSFNSFDEYGEAFFKITAKKVGHANDSTQNDNDPKVILSNLVVKVNDTVSSEYNLNSSYVNSNSGYYHTTHISSSSLSFEDTTSTGFFHNDVELYEDTTTSFSVSTGDKIEVSGNIKLADGTAYDPSSNGTQGRIEFTFNNHPSTAGNKLQVFIDPSYNSGAVGTTESFTTVSS